MTTSPDLRQGQTSTFTQQWIESTSLQKALKLVDDGTEDVSLAQELLDACLEVCSVLWPQLKSSKAFEVHQLNALKEVVGNLHLFSVGFSDGKLTCALSQSDELGDSVLEVVSAISQSILNRFVSATILEHSGDLITQVADLKVLLQRSKFIISNYGDQEIDNTTFDGDGPELLLAAVPAIQEKEISEESAGPHGEFISDSLAEGIVGSHSTTLKDHDTLASSKHISNRRSSFNRETDALAMLDSESDSGDSLSAASSSHVYSFFQCRTECLMDLVPTIERCLSHGEEMIFKPPTARVAFSVTEAARPLKLVERLGEANWQRFVQMRDLMANISEPMQEANTKETPKSVFTHCTLFHDSGIGTSVAPGTNYAASHTSFISSNAEEDCGSLRVPATPAEVSEGKPFRCFICTNMLYNIRTRIDWKMHVFSDLKPYICTVESCPSKLTQFSTRKLWETHEFNEHRVSRSWRCPFCLDLFDCPKDLEGHLPSKHDYRMSSLQLQQLIKIAEARSPSPIEDQVCPLCQVVPGKSQRNFATHVGRHMETIALAVLPTTLEDESDENSIDSTYDRCASISDEKMAVPDVSSQVSHQSGVSSTYTYSTTKHAYNPAEVRQVPVSYITPPPINQTPNNYAPLSGFSYGIVQAGPEGGRCPDPDCGRMFKDLKAHMLTHQTERPEKCPFVTCDYHKKGFARRYDKQRHLLTHYKGTMVCGFCPGSGSAAEKSFNRADVFKRHLILVHGVEKSSLTSPKKSPSAKRATSQSSNAITGKCSTCGVIFDNTENFYDHLDECVIRVLLQGNLNETNKRNLTPVANDKAARKTFPSNMLSSDAKKLQNQDSNTGLGLPPDFSKEVSVNHGPLDQDKSKDSSSFAGAAPKKRRSRKPPHEPCQSCYITETPEWRRGPDGSRSLCNACGLYYAKLTQRVSEPHWKTSKVSDEPVHHSRETKSNPDRCSSTSLPSTRPSGVEKSLDDSIQK